MNEKFELFIKSKPMIKHHLPKVFLLILITLYACTQNGVTDKTEETMPQTPMDVTQTLTVESELTSTADLNDQNQDNAVVSVKKVMQKFNITYVTTATRIDSLEKKKLLFTKKQGKIRAIFNSEKGKQLLQRRKIN